MKRSRRATWWTVILSVLGLILVSVGALDAQPITLDLNDYFYDPDDDPLTFDATVEPPGIVRLALCRVPLG